MHDLPNAAGPLAADYAAVDWEASPVGDPSTWSEAMRAALDVVLHSRYPAALLWGPRFVQVYNAAYADLIGEKHPRALGRPTEECFAEVWPDLGPLMAGVLAGGDAVFVEDSLVPLRRHGFVEDCWFTFCYSPVHHRDGHVEGVVDIAMETTREVLAARRVRLLARLNDALAGVDSVEELRAVTIAELRGEPDLPEVELRDPAPDTVVAAGSASDAEVVTLGPSEVRLPVHRASSGVQTVLDVHVHAGLPFDDEYRSFLRLVASTVSRAWDRLAALEREREQATRQRRFVAALQQSLLALPGTPTGLEVVVRYRAAVADAQVGGDWYDAFVVDQDLVVSVGDVAGHDERAVAQMAQIRGLLRGLSHATRSSPSSALAALDGAMDALSLTGIASAVLAHVSRSGPNPGSTEVHTVRLANAGHPTPVHLRRDGTARLVSREPELLLGVDPGTPRSDGLVELHPGEALLLYTDGLVERRDRSLDEGLQWLVDEVSRRRVATVEDLCDHLLSTVEGAEDDVAILVVRVPAHDG